MEQNMNLEGMEQEKNLFEVLFGGSGEVESFAPSMEVQAAEIREVFMDIPELQFENWQNLDVNERVEALQQLENEVAEIAHRPALEITAETMREGLMGQCGPYGIKINADALASDSYGMYRENLDTLFHEGRHAYQRHNVETYTLGIGTVEENQVMVQSWYDNYIEMGYETGDWPGYEDIGFLHYLNQPVEVDARVFADEVIRTLNV